MRQRPLDAERWRPGADGDTALEQRPDALDQRCRQFAQVRQGALLRPALLVAKALAQQHGGGRGAVRHGLDEHGGSRFAHRQQDGKPHMDTNAKELTLNPLSGRAYQVIHSKNFGLKCRPKTALYITLVNRNTSSIFSLLGTFPVSSWRATAILALRRRSFCSLEVFMQILYQNSSHLSSFAPLIVARVLHHSSTHK